MSRGYKTGDGRVLRLDPLKLLFGLKAANREPMKTRKQSDENALVYYLIKVQDFTFEDIAELVETTSVEDLKKIYYRKKTRLLEKEQKTLAEKLGVPLEILLMHARAASASLEEWLNLPWFVPVLDRFGNDSGELMWFNLRWFSERMKSMDNVSVFKVPDSRMAVAGIKPGDLALILVDEAIFEDGAIYLLRGHDGILHLRQAKLAAGDGDKKTRTFVIPGKEDVIYEAEMKGREGDPALVGRADYILTSVL